MTIIGFLISRPRVAIIFLSDETVLFLNVKVIITSFAYFHSILSFWFPQRKTVLLNAFLFTAESTFDAPGDNLFRCFFPTPRLGHETHDTDRSQGCHCSSPQQIQPWEPCCEKYLIDVQPIEHNCVSYITGMQYCNHHAIQSLGILSWKASVFVKVSVIIGRPHYGWNLILSLPLRICGPQWTSSFQLIMKDI